MPGIRDGSEGRVNDIQIMFFVSPVYMLSEAFIHEEGLKSVSLEPHQIRQVDIVKSYDTHVTDVFITFDTVDPSVIAAVTEGKLLMRLEIGSKAPIDPKMTYNYFTASHMEILDTTEVLVNYPAISCRGTFKSLTRVRLENENIFAFELGGKGGQVIGAHQKPHDFYNGPFKALYAHEYTTRSFDEFNQTVFNDRFTKKIADTVIPVGPDTGYFFEVSNNLEALDYFFSYYQMYYTKMNWVLDDFNIISGYNPSVLCTADLVRYDTWLEKVHETPGLNSLFNLDKNDMSGALSTFTSIKGQKIDHKMFYNNFRYDTRENGPIIYATNVHTGAVIPTDTWNAQHINKTVMVPSNTGYSIKSVVNPLRSEFKTYMNGFNVEKVFGYKKVFYNLNPEFTTYRYQNLYFGEIDLNMSISIGQESLAPDENHGVDKAGFIYQVKHTFTRTTLQPAGVMPGNLGNKQAHIAGPDATFSDSAFTPSFLLTTEATYFIVDQGPMTLRGYNQTVAQRGTSEFTVNDGDISNMILDPCAAGGAGTPGTSGDGDGIPGNSSIADQAKYIIGTAKGYRLGRKDPNGYIDCSGFTAVAVRRAGADKGYGSRFGGGTIGQKSWLEKYALPISPENRQRGDIVFFNGSLGANRHVAIVADKGSTYEAASTKRGVIHRPMEGRRITACYRLVPLAQRQSAEGGK